MRVFKLSNFNLQYIVYVSHHFFPTFLLCQEACECHPFHVHTFLYFKTNSWNKLELPNKKVAEVSLTLSFQSKYFNHNAVCKGITVVLRLKSRPPCRHCFILGQNPPSCDVNLVLKNLFRSLWFKPPSGSIEPSQLPSFTYLFVCLFFFFFLLVCFHVGI